VTPESLKQIPEVLIGNALELIPIHTTVRFGGPVCTVRATEFSLPLAA